MLIFIIFERLLYHTNTKESKKTAAKEVEEEPTPKKEEKPAPEPVVEEPVVEEPVKEEPVAEAPVEDDSWLKEVRMDDIDLDIQEDDDE